MSRLLLTLFLLCHLTFVLTQPTNTNATSSTSIPTSNITTTPTQTITPNNITTTNTTSSNTTETPTSTSTQMTNVTTTATPTNASSTTVPPTAATTTTATPTTVTPTTATPTTPAPAVVTTSAPTNAATTVTPTTATPTTATPATATPTTSSPTHVSSSSSTGIGGGIIPNPPTSPTLANKASTSSESFTDLYITRYQTYYYIAAGIIGGIILAIICGLYIKRRIRIQRVMKSSQHHVRGTCDLPGVDLDLETGDNKEQQEITASPLSSLDHDGHDHDHHRAPTESMAVSITSYGEIEGNISGIRKRQSEAEEARIERRRTRQESVQPIEETRDEVMPHRPSESQEEREARMESRRATPLPSYV